MKRKVSQSEITEKKVFSYLEKHGMIAAGDKIVVGVSGGADSVCLLFLLLEYGKRASISLGVAHVNHGLRADAGEDAGYVEELCREQGLPFYLTEADVREYAAREKCSEEDAGRRVRYQAFYQAAEKMGGAKIAVAHNRDDNAETLLLRLFRGSGLKGLCGIAPVRDEIIRPLLCLERREVEAYLKERGIPWRTDSTNGEDHYCRNRIRHHVLPCVETWVAQGVSARLCRTAELLAETEDYMAGQTAEALERCAVSEKNGGRWAVDVQSFLQLHKILQGRVLLALAGELSPTGKDISAVHVEEMGELFAREGNRAVSLPFGIRAERQYGRVILERRDQAPRAPSKEGGGTAFEFALPSLEGDCPASLELGNGLSVECSIFFYKKSGEVPRNDCTKWLDYDKMIEYPVIRFRRPGDYLTIADGRGGLNHKSLKNYMITEKIPRELRDRIPVLAQGSHVIWLAGYRVSEYFKIGENTKRVLQVELKRDCLSSETEEENAGTHQSAFFGGRGQRQDQGNRRADRQGL